MFIWINIHIYIQFLVISIYSIVCMYICISLGSTSLVEIQLIYTIWDTNLEVVLLRFN